MDPILFTQLSDHFQVDIQPTAAAEGTGDTACCSCGNRLEIKKINIVSATKQGVKVGD